MARIYAGSLCHSPPSPILNCAPVLRTALLRTVLRSCCERFSRAAIRGSASSAAQAGRRQGSHADKGNSVTLGREAYVAAAGQLSRLICADSDSPAGNGSGESKCEEIERSHGEVTEK